MGKLAVQQGIPTVVAAEHRGRSKLWGVPGHTPGLCVLVLAGASAGADGRDGECYIAPRWFSERRVNVAAACRISQEVAAQNPKASR